MVNRPKQCGRSLGGVGGENSSFKKVWLDYSKEPLLDIALLALLLI